MNDPRERPVAVMDSGVGGLPYLSWIQEHLPREQLIYVADRKNFPYGPKAPEAVRAAVLETAQALVRRHGPKILVLACNTASVTSLGDLRAAFPDIPVVGVVPAVKVAAAQTRNGRIGVLATERTIQDPYLHRLIGDFAAEHQVHLWPAAEIVDYVEDGVLKPDPERGQELMSRWAERARHDGVDTVVLACTHFLHVTEELQKPLGPDIRLVDSREGVGRQTQRLLTEKGLTAAKKAGPDRLYITLGAVQAARRVEYDTHYRAFAARFGLDYAGVLE